MITVFLLITTDFGDNFIFIAPTSRGKKIANFDTLPNPVPVADAGRVEMFI